MEAMALGLVDKACTAQLHFHFKNVAHVQLAVVIELAPLPSRGLELVSYCQVPVADRPMLPGSRLLVPVLAIGIRQTF